MTRHSYIIVFITTIMLLICDKPYAQRQEEACTFSFEEYYSGGIRLPYRQAVITESESPSNLIIYLHGGTSKGNDNLSQMKEAAIDSVSHFIQNYHLNAVFIVPQCPVNESWAGKLTGVLKSLIEDRKSHFTEIEYIYLLGSSMGGTGTWTMISKYPGVFSAAMPVAGNPSRCDVNNVAQTPLFTVMGTNDQIMDINVVRDFISSLNKLGAQYVFDTEEGWTHEDTCIKSYTTDRLNWLFSHARQPETTDFIQDNIPKQRGFVSTRYWTLSGIPITNPSRGFYLMQTISSDKSVRTSKSYIR